uniref:Uncharacterized protein n=1 Tax=Solanum lycopersicum TaxID=4081 RepID=A0A3Q7HMR4_SOLLC
MTGFYLELLRSMSNQDVCSYEKIS